MALPWQRLGWKQEEDEPTSHGKRLGFMTVGTRQTGVLLLCIVYRQHEYCSSVPLAGSYR